MLNRFGVTPANESPTLQEDIPVKRKRSATPKALEHEADPVVGYLELHASDVLPSFKKGKGTHKKKPIYIKVEEAATTHRSTHKSTITEADRKFLMEVARSKRPYNRRKTNVNNKDVKGTGTNKPIKIPEDILRDGGRDPYDPNKKEVEEQSSDDDFSDSD